MDGYDMAQTDKEVLNQFTKPECKLLGEDGNVFNVIGRVCKALRRAGLKEQADEFQSKAFNASDYNEVLRLAMEYTEVV